MCDRESLSRRCVLVKDVHEEVEENCLTRCVQGVESCHRHNELSLGKGETRWIVLLTSESAAEKLIRDGQVTLTSHGQEWKCPVGGCPECILPDEWVDNCSTRTNASFFSKTLQDSIGMENVRYREDERGNQHLDDVVRCDSMLQGSDDYIKVEKPEKTESQDTYTPTFAIPAISSPVCKLDLADSDTYTKLQLQHSEQDGKYAKLVPHEEMQNHPPIPPPRRVDKSVSPCRTDESVSPHRVDKSVSPHVSDTADVNMSESAKRLEDEENPYHTINDTALKSHVVDHYEPPPLPLRTNGSPRKEELSSTYMEAMTRSQLDMINTSTGVPAEESCINQTPRASVDDEASQSQHGDHDVSPRVPQRMNRNQSKEVSSSTYSMEPVPSSSTYIEPVPSRQPRTDIKSDSQDAFLRFKQSSENFSSPSEGSSHSKQTTSDVVVSDQRTPGGQTEAIVPTNQRATQRDSGDRSEEKHIETGYPRTLCKKSDDSKTVHQMSDVCQGTGGQTPRKELYENVSMFRRPEHSPRISEQDGRSSTCDSASGSKGTGPLQRNTAEETEVKQTEIPGSTQPPLMQINPDLMVPQGHPGVNVNPGMVPNFMMNPQLQGFMPPGMMMGTQDQQQQNTPQFLPYPQFPHFPFPMQNFPFPQLQAQERFPMPEPQTPGTLPRGEGVPEARREPAERVPEARREPAKRVPEARREPAEEPLNDRKQPGRVIHRAPPKDEDTITEAAVDESSFDTIRVRLTQPSSQDALENYFENHRRSGGGAINSLRPIKEENGKIKEALITFSESKDARGCLQKTHTLEGSTVTVEKYDPNDPDQWEMNKALVTGVNPVTTDDTLTNFLEPAAGVEPTDVVRGTEPSTAIVVFDEKPDFAKMSKRCKTKQLDGNTLFIQMVEKCKSVYVGNVDESITYDTVENFFCNKKRSGGGEVEKVDYHPEDGYCLVHFENPSDAENVAQKKKFTISGKEIKVDIFHPCLGLPEQPIAWDNLPCVSVDCNRHVLKFIKNCKAVCSEIEVALQKRFIKVEWPKSKSDTNVKLLCTVTKEMENAKSTLKNWKENAEKEMERKIEKFMVQKHSVLPDVWKSFVDQLRKLNVDQPDKVAVLPEAKENTVVIVGYEENAEALTRKILDIIKTEEMAVQSQKEKITKRADIDFHKCQQLWKTHFGKKIKDDFPDVDVNIEINKNEVNFTGKPREVNEAMIKMHEYLVNTKSKSLKISKGRHELFSKKHVRERFIAKLKSKNNKAVWNVTQDKIEMTSSKIEVVDKALKIFEEFIPEKGIKVQKLVKILTTPEWQTCIKQMKETHGEELHIVSSASEVCVTATEDIFQKVLEEIEQVLETCSKKCSVDRKVVRLTEIQYNYLKYFGEKHMKQIKEDATAHEQELEISKKQEDYSIEVVGNEEEVGKAEKRLRKFVDELKEDTCSMTKPGAKAFFNSAKGIENLKTTGKATSCIIMNKERIKHNVEKRGSGSYERHQRGSGSYEGHQRGSGSYEGHRRRSSPKFPIKVAECKLLPIDKKFIVMKGDVTKLKVDVIVNAANGDLDHCGGLALAISKAGGRSIQEESSAYNKSNGIVPDGDAIPAKPGLLPCQMLIHAVGPRWQGGNNEEEVKLRKAILKCLNLADRNNYTSIVIPALSAGIFGYPVRQSVDTIISSIQFYFKSREGKDSKLGEIFFCDVDDSITAAFISCLRRKFGQEVSEFDEEDGPGPVHQVPMQGKDSSDEEENRFPLSDKKKAWKIKVISGELAKMKVDVIVNSVDKSLDLSIGATSKSLYHAGGERLQDECRLKCKDGIQPGKVVVTKGGNLKCRQVYHGNIKRWDHYKGDALGTLRGFVDECLHLADVNQMTSIAFPALGTGRLGYSADLIAKTMFSCCRQFHSQNKYSSTLKEIFFVIYHKDTEIFQAFQTKESENESRGAESESRGAEGQYRQSGYRYRGERPKSTGAGGGDKSWKLNKLSVEIRQGDITQERSDAVVNSITESMDLSKGAASKAILHAAGDGIQAECRRGAQTFSSEGYVVTSGGRMSCKYIIHVKAQKSADGWERMVSKALAHADKTGCSSISFPALGTGVRTSDPAEIAKFMFKAMRKFSPETLRTVRVIIFQRDMVSVFLSVLKTLPQDVLTHVKDYVLGKYKDFVGDDSDDENEGTRIHWSNQSHDHGNRGHGSYHHGDRDHGSRQANSKVTFQILSNSRDNIRKAKNKLDEVLESECSKQEIDISKHTVAEKQIEDIKRITKGTNFRVVGNKTIVLEGLKSEVNDAALAIYQYLHKAKDKESAQTIQKYVKWQYEVSADKWVSFQDQVNYQLETAYQRKEKSCTVTDRTGTEYIVDFTKMVEFEKNKSKKYKVQRLDRGERGMSSVGVPSKWAPMKSKQTMVEISLKPGDNEYKQVLAKFQASSQGGVNVAEIRRVQNPFLYQQYAAKRKEIQVKNGNKDPQQWLWHGTYPETVDKVINNGFNRSYCGRHGTSYGAGVYFAVNASYSLGYCRADSNGHKHMFSVQVATGDACQGSGSMNVLPSKPGAGSHVTYDSASDNPSNPVMYVIFHDSQAYPAYHIIFK